MLITSSTTSQELYGQYQIQVSITSISNPDLSITFQTSTPQNVDETPAISQFRNIDIQGRSSVYYFNNVSNRSVSFPLQLAADAISGASMDSFKKAINILKALGRPQYTSNGIVPNYVYCRIGDWITVKGIYRLGNLKWSGPLRDGGYSVVTTNITIDEVREENLNDDDVLDNGEYEIINI